MTRQPILSRALILAALGVGYATLAHFGVGVPPGIREAVDALALAGVPVALAYWARRHTTPAADPRDAQGTPLAPMPNGADVRQEAAGAERADTPDARHKL